mgnify:CR=1 FL=1
MRLSVAGMLLAATAMLHVDRVTAQKNKNHLSVALGPIGYRHRNAIKRKWRRGRRWSAGASHKGSGRTKAAGFFIGKCQPT